MQSNTTSKNFWGVFKGQAALVMEVRESQLQSSNSLFNYNACRARYFVEPFLLPPVNLTNVAVKPKHRHHLTHGRVA